MHHLAPALLSLLALAPMATAQRLVAIDGVFGRIYQLNPFTGASTAIGTISNNTSAPLGLTFDFSTNTVYLNDVGYSGLFTLDVATGAATFVGFYGSSSISMHSIAYDSANDALYGASGGTNTKLYTIDRTTGAATLDRK